MAAVSQDPDLGPLYPFQAVTAMREGKDPVTLTPNDQGGTGDPVKIFQDR